MNESQEKYRKFLQTDLWKSLSKRRKLGIVRCESCRKKAKNLECHHVRYPARWEDTKVTDLIVLCRACHREMHGLSTRGWIEYGGRTDKENAIFHRTFCLRRRLSEGKKLRDRDVKFLNRAIAAFPKTKTDSAIWFHCNSILKMESELYGIH